MSENQRQRYRQAAEDALQQLDWCIGYLHGIRKKNISRQLARNRAHIRRNLMHEAAESLPSEAQQKPDHRLPAPNLASSGRDSPARRLSSRRRRSPASALATRG
jgi:hypothetical protein